jgi:hypothetical protein
VRAHVCVCVESTVVTHTRQGLSILARMGVKLYEELYWP